ncbi:hypothetical protein AB3U99_19720 [Niallia sp. JL1B1071]|uniref:hypothetical protein n=1 Tax=Niallia tiangongensis TaxID=3237105 RepID=UPI0037DC8ECC
MIKDLWRKDESLSKLEHVLKDADAVSFDIFDTLLLRTVSDPTDLFIELGKISKEKGYFKKDTTEFEFQQIRILSEQLARKKKRNNSKDAEEVSIDDIYELIPDNMFIKDDIKRLEIELEKQVCYVNPVINSFVNYCVEKNKKIYLISDMYLSHNQIQDILLFNNFDIKKINKIYVSSEYLVTKHEGALFKIISSEQYLSYDKWIHIGDNEIADVKQPKKLGIRGYIYNSKIRNGLFQYEKIMYGNILPEIFSLRKVINNLKIDINENEKFWYKLGTGVLGPFLSLFAEWILDIAERENIQQIRPFMREGILLEKVLKQAAFKRELKVDISCLFVSREATTFPKTYDIEKEYVDSFFDNNRRGITVKDFLEKFNLGNWEDEYKEYMEIELHETEKIKKNKLNLKEELILLLTDKESAKISSDLQRRKENFGKYLEQEIDLSKPFITVDLGFRGTIQENIETMLVGNKTKHQSIHLIAMGSEEVKYKLQNGIDIRGFIANAGYNLSYVKPILREPSIIEQLHMNETGSTLYYETQNEKIVPVLDNNRIPMDEIKKKKMCQNGVLEFNKCFLELLYSKKHLKQRLLEKREQIGQLISRIYNLPTHEEAFNLMNLHHDDNYGSKRVSTLYNEELLQQLDLLGIEGFLNSRRFKHIPWPEAIVTLKYPNKLFVNTVLKSSHVPPYTLETLEVAKKLDFQNIKEVIIYGAGEVGHRLIESLRFFNISVLAFIDKNELLWGDVIDDVKIISIEDAKEIKCQSIIIASFVFVDEIKQRISENFRGADIYTIDIL